MKKIFYLLLSLSVIFLICGCSNAQNLTIKEKNGRIYLTVPEALNNNFSLSKPLISAGFEVAENDNLSFSISSEDYKTFLETLRAKINDNIANINENDSYTSLSEVKIDDELKKLEVTIDPSEYESSDDTVIIKALTTEIILYKIYAGEKANLEVKYIDAESKSVYDTEKISY